MSKKKNASVKSVELDAQAPELETAETAETVVFAEPEVSELKVEVVAVEGKHVATSEPQFPRVLKMLKKFKIEYPLPYRRDESMRLTLKEGQEITDQYMIKYLMKNPEAPFVIKE